MWRLCDGDGVSDWDTFLQGTDWSEALKSEFEKMYWGKLRDYIDRQRATHPDAIIHRIARSTPRSSSRPWPTPAS